MRLLHSPVYNIPVCQEDVLLHEKFAESSKSKRDNRKLMWSLFDCRSIARSDTVKKK